MAISDTKIVQSFIQRLIEIANLVERADTLAQAVKTKYQNSNPSLTDTGVTSGQITAINTFITDLHTLATSAVVTTVKSKDVPSHPKL